VPVTQRQLAAFADDHQYTIPINTSPRYWAGPGDARHITHALLAAGWTNHSDPAAPAVHLTSPDHHLDLRLDPAASTCWRLTGEPPEGPRWYASFGHMVPAEILAGLTDALIAPAPEDVPDLWHVLAAADWRCTRHDDGTGHAVSPDQHVRLEHHKRADAWSAEVAREFGPPVWSAWLQDTTPAHLLSGFATALADPKPLQRRSHDRCGHYMAVQEPSGLTEEHFVKAHMSRLKAVRAQARAALRTRHAAPPQAQHRTIPALPPAVTTRSR